MERTLLSPELIQLLPPSISSFGCLLRLIGRNCDGAERKTKVFENDISNLHSLLITFPSTRGHIHAQKGLVRIELLAFSLDTPTLLCMFLSSDSMFPLTSRPRSPGRWRSCLGPGCAWWWERRGRPSGARAAAVPRGRAWKKTPFRASSPGLPTAVGRGIYTRIE